MKDLKNRIQCCLEEEILPVDTAAASAPEIRPALRILDLPNDPVSYSECLHISSTSSTSLTSTLINKQTVKDFDIAFPKLNN